MNVTMGGCLVLLNLLLVGCSKWPVHGEGGMAERTERLASCSEVHAGSAYGALDQRLACANRRFETLKRVGAQLHQPALSEQARLQSQRVWRQLTGGLTADAITDLAIYGALLDEIERRLLSQGFEDTTVADESKLVTADAEVIKAFGHVLFASGSDSVNPADLEGLLTVAESLRIESQGDITLTGYTDEQGDDDSNLLLALERARNVKRVLISFDVDPLRIHVQTQGEHEPFYPNSNRPGRLANRRVDIHLATSVLDDSAPIQPAQP